MPPIQIHQRMHNHLPDETTLHNGQKFELLSLALLGVPSMSDTFQELTNKLTALKFDSADFVCLKFILLLNPGKPLFNLQAGILREGDDILLSLIDHLSGMNV